MKKLIIIGTFSIFLLLGCTEDFLDVSQTESIKADDLTLLNNDEGAKSFVTAVYNKFLDFNFSTFSWIGMTSIASDDADKGSSPGDTGADKDLMDALTYNASSLSVQEVFVSHYEAINRCNQALNILPKLDRADPNLKVRLIGEVKFLRALIYFNLVRCYGGVPIVDRLPNPSSDEDRILQLTRRSKQEVYDFIEQDLNDAILVLPNKSAYSSTEIARASLGAAHALLAKVSLYQQKWQQVVDNCNAITGYALAPNYAVMFRLEGENDIESIFEIQGVGTVPVKGIQGYSQTQGARGAGGWGWGFNTPSLSLLNAYESGDVRRNATILFAGTTLYDGRVVPNTVENPRYNYKAYSSAFTDAWESDKNLKILRYGEVLLLKAEALNELNQTSAAIPLLNQIRNRATLGNTTAVSKEQVREAIWRERRVELAFEHDRFFDLVRTGKAEQAFALDGKTFVVAKHEVFPLPQVFINESVGFSIQNNGY